MKRIEFGKKLQEIRNKKGESQTDLGALLGVGVKQIQRYENGEVPPPHESLELLNKLYGYDFISLFYDLKSDDSDNQYREEYIALLKKLDDKNEKIITEKEADLVALRSAVNGINEVKGKVEKLEPIVYDLSSKVEVAESNIEVLREWLIDQFSKMKKESPQSVASSLGRKKEDLRKKEKQ
jgi:transcriptional regulator with XRE-family HTH domain